MPVTLRLLAVACLLLPLSQMSAAEDAPFCIRVVDEDTGRGVPLVELTTVNNVRYYTDSAGIVAFQEPGLAGQRVFLHVKSHGYEFQKDGFGYRGARLQIEPGGEATLKIKRINIAERLYRVTGGGIYRDSVLTGRPVPIKEPALNAQVFGSDSVVNTIYKGRIYWFWGDTNRPSYPLGNFHVPGATSRLPRDGGLDPNSGVNLDYFVDDSGFARPTARLPGKGPTWINGLVTLHDADGRERLFCTYVKVQPPLKIYERGLAEFDDDAKQFTKVTAFDLQAPVFPGGHPQLQTDDGVEYVYFGDPFPLVRVKAQAESLTDLAQYEAYTCLADGSRKDSLNVERNESGPIFRWRTNTVRYTPELQSRLIKERLLDSGEGLFQLYDDAGKPVLIHRGTVSWNDYRKRWIMIAVQSFGTSLLGEVWYAESEQQTGPWKNARKIVTHEKYSFYNPKQHVMFDQAGGRVVFFEGTYTNTFSGNDDATPRYNYNQVMYRLDLSDPRLQ